MLRSLPEVAMIQAGPNPRAGQRLSNYDYQNLPKCRSKSDYWSSDPVFQGEHLCVCYYQSCF